MSFLDTTQQSQVNYNALQSQIAVGSGQTWGRGLGQGIQSHLRFLPERQTDFIFASFAEEVGFVGAVSLIILYLILILTIWRTAVRASNQVQKLVCFSILTMFLTQTIVNIGMNMGLMPITGITLPFISYGGSSILALSFCLGLTLSLL